MPSVSLIQSTTVKKVLACLFSRVLPASQWSVCCMRMLTAERAQRGDQDEVGVGGGAESGRASGSPQLSPDHASRASRWRPGESPKQNQRWQPPAWDAMPTILSNNETLRSTIIYLKYRTGLEGAYTKHGSSFYFNIFCRQAASLSSQLGIIIFPLFCLFKS